MRWTDGSGAAYGEDPYGGAGYTYAYGHEYAPTGQWTSPTGQATYRTGQATTAWDPLDPLYGDLCGDALTGPLPVFDAARLSMSDTAQIPDFDAPRHPVPEPDTPESESAGPVFVDSSGRRQRRVLRAARLLMIPAGGYVAVLISAMLGGPSISSPFVPHADSPHSATPTATAPDSSSGTGHPARSASPTTAGKSSGATARQTPSPTGRPPASTTPAAPSRHPAAPTRTAAPAHSSKGRGLGSSHKHVK
ncbi:hypothetical protein IPZ61_29130 [Streptomyces sioyaensis]|uniref:hypothetical protein n=1 Tax=Streptomyces sioyaensis TaxID=67364 RepID=UPI001F356308|nr:hypothetical protein [Streptomyces sioyaensis]MCF3177368.1 hypothetical protein [Streptomyces sioyaensis]